MISILYMQTPRCTLTHALTEVVFMSSFKVESDETVLFDGDGMQETQRSHRVCVCCLSEFR